jgi:hypothetical protein
LHRFARGERIALGWKENRIEHVQRVEKPLRRGLDLFVFCSHGDWYSITKTWLCQYDFEDYPDKDIENSGYAELEWLFIRESVNTNLTDCAITVILWGESKALPRDREGK